MVPQIIWGYRFCFLSFTGIGLPSRWFDCFAVRGRKPVEMTKGMGWLSTAGSEGLQLAAEHMLLTSPVSSAIQTDSMNWIGNLHSRFRLICGMLDATLVEVLKSPWLLARRCRCGSSYCFCFQRCSLAQILALAEENQ